MAKKKKNKKTIYTKKKSLSNALKSIKRFFIGISIVVACLSGLLFLFNGYFPVEEAKRIELPQETLSDQAKLPQLKNNRKEQLINHEGFTVSYNADFRIANWVAYELTANEVRNRDVQRATKFSPDPEVKGVSATDNDYRRSGYDRGHLVPAADMRWSEKGMRASFYFSNICPQNRELNAGLWNNIERQCRTWATNYGEIVIITGPVIEDNMNRLGENKVGIPNKFYKVVGSTSNGEAKSIGFLVENRNYENRLLKDVAVTVDSIERVTGIRFFTSFPIEVQQEMKSAIDWKYWKFSKSN
ncbi:MAG: DNA/RNA non-specific endonuclease [Tannerellaceae bacterium]|jgi:endonuclease G|nr:DNA/RNA non-specific endonuclease [Tannerellaceae bacterium]